MEKDNPSVVRGRGNAKRTTDIHRVWSNRDEEVLLSALKELVSNGWKSDLEEVIKKVYQHTDLQKDPNIISKLTTWKKTYGSLVTT